MFYYFYTTAFLAACYWPWPAYVTTQLFLSGKFYKRHNPRSDFLVGQCYRDGEGLNQASSLLQSLHRSVNPKFFQQHPQSKSGTQKTLRILNMNIIVCSSDHSQQRIIAADRSDTVLLCKHRTVKLDDVGLGYQILHPLTYFYCANANEVPCIDLMLQIFSVLPFSLVVYFPP